MLMRVITSLGGKMSRGDRELDSYLKAQSWVAKHYRQIIIASLVVAFLSVFSVFVMSIRFNATISKQAEAIKNLSSKVVLVRADGKVAILDKEEISQTFLQSSLRDLINYLLLSGFDLDGIYDFKDLIKNRKVGKVVSHLAEGGQPGYKAYLEQVWRAYKADNLPEVVWVGDASAIRDQLSYQGASFKYYIEIPLNILYVKYQRWNRGQGKAVIYMEGNVDVSRSSPENPLGIYIEKLEVRQYVVKE